MRNSSISTKKCQLGATPKTAQIFLIFSAQSLLVKCNKGSLVEQQVSRKKFSHVSLGHIFHALGPGAEKEMPPNQSPKVLETFNLSFFPVAHSLIFCIKTSATIAPCSCQFRF